jgi:hypothetical protein
MTSDSKQIHYRVIDEIHINVGTPKGLIRANERHLRTKNNHYYQNSISLGGD